MKMKLKSKHRKTKQNNTAILRFFVSFSSVVKALKFAFSFAGLINQYMATINAQHTMHTGDGIPVVQLFLVPIILGYDWSVEMETIEKMPQTVVKSQLKKCLQVQMVRRTGLIVDVT